MAVVARGRAHHYCGRVGVFAAVLFITRECTLDGRFGARLQFQVDGGLDGESALEEEAGAVRAGLAELFVVEEPLLNVFNEIGRGVLLLEDRHVVYQLDRLKSCELVLFEGDVAVRIHAQQHEVAPVSGLLGVQVRVVAARCLNEAC